MGKSNSWVMVVVLVVLIGFAAWWFMGKDNMKISTTKYQAVFLTNGQVYFGQVSNEKSDPVMVKDIYYLRVQRQIQPAAEGAEADKPQVSLIKLGNELHGPTDAMRINREQILFIEDLKDDGKVVKAIAEDKNKPAAESTEKKSE